MRPLASSVKPVRHAIAGRLSEIARQPVVHVIRTSSQRYTAAQAQIYQPVMKMPAGMDTIVGERGLKVLFTCAYRRTRFRVSVRIQVKCVRMRLHLRLDAGAASQLHCSPVSVISVTLCTSVRVRGMRGRLGP